jgi:hypothetical protein
VEEARVRREEEELKQAELAFDSFLQARVNPALDKWISCCLILKINVEQYLLTLICMVFLAALKGCKAFSQYLPLLYTDILHHGGVNFKLFSNIKLNQMNI